MKTLGLCLRKSCTFLTFSVSVLVFLTCAVLFAQNAKIMNSTGTWKLNMEKSHSSEKGPPPNGAVLKIVHKEPAYKYSYTETSADGKTSTVEFDGVIDGKPYKQPDGTTATLKRMNDSTLGGTSTSADGKTTEESTWVISKDGKVGTYESTSKGSEGVKTTLLVFEKQ